MKSWSSSRTKQTTSRSNMARIKRIARKSTVYVVPKRVTNGGGAARKSRRYRPSTVALREIRSYQKTTKRVIVRKRLVRGIRLARRIRGERG